MRMRMRMPVHRYNVSMYQVVVCQITGSCSASLATDGCVTQATSGYVPSGSRVYQATGLEPYTRYRIRVRANSSGFPSFDDCDGANCPWVSSGCSDYTRDFPTVPASLRVLADYGSLNNVTYLWPEWNVRACSRPCAPVHCEHELAHSHRVTLVITRTCTWSLRHRRRQASA